MTLFEYTTERGETAALIRHGNELTLVMRQAPHYLPISIELPRKEAADLQCALLRDIIMVKA